MKSKHFSFEQAVSVILQRKVRLSVARYALKMGVAESTLCTWKEKYLGLELDEVRELNKLREDIVGTTEKSSSVLQRKKLSSEPTGELEGLVSTSSPGGV
ncbi:transposase [Idiomarina xiamenensis]|uniref:Transposase IS3/IS911 n=1 Tax=Idiomarina xiamenensis 10-D-4 TaxID=740709 RepID=K2JLB6_9GAMM|nr:transposase [Idiomarina xiamenensis]EKE84256.1 transposase IS3/IS911 [Idiomarina xiamenensis 10-D-4]